MLSSLIQQSILSSIGGTIANTRSSIGFDTIAEGRTAINVYGILFAQSAT